MKYNVAKTPLGTLGRPVWAYEVSQERGAEEGIHESLPRVNLNSVPRVPGVAAHSGWTLLLWARLKASSLWLPPAQSNRKQCHLPNLPTPLSLRKRYQETPTPCDLMTCSPPQSMNLKVQEWRKVCPGRCWEMLGNLRWLGVWTYFADGWWPGLWGIQEVGPGGFPAWTLLPSFLLSSYSFPSMTHVKVIQFQGKKICVA